jgi:hypothetical protein
MLNNAIIILIEILIKTILFLIICSFLPDAYADNSEQASANPCQISAMVGYKAYLWAIEDAKHPDYKRLDYAVNYWGDMMILKHERPIAHKAAIYIAKRLKPTGMRLPDHNVAYEAAREFMVKECLK